jgi:hypothetical protein
MSSRGQYASTLKSRSYATLMASRLWFAVLS